MNPSFQCVPHTFGRPNTGFIGVCMGIVIIWEKRVRILHHLFGQVAMKVQGGNDRNLRSHFVSKRLQQRSFSIRVSFCHHSAMESQQNTIHTLQEFPLIRFELLEKL